MPGDPLELRLYAHRGCSARAPENSLAAFRLGLAEGAVALELDLRLSADRVPVVFHDADGERTAGERAEVAATPLAALRRWELGDGERVPTFEEVLAELPPVPITADLKVGGAAAAAAVIETVERQRATDRVTLASFDDRQVARLRRLGYRGPTALTRGEVAALRILPLAFARRLVVGSAAEIPRRAGPLRLDGPRLLGRCRRLGVRADYWVVNDLGVARELLERGATGVMSDDPACLAPLFAELGGRQAAE